jgi:ferredoxin
MPVVIGMYEFQSDGPPKEFLLAARDYMRTPEYGRSFASVRPSQMRTIPVNKSFKTEHYVATYDQIRHLVKSSKGPFVILKCICREAQHMQGKKCEVTSRIETCLGMGDSAAVFIKRGKGREISAEEAIAVLEQNENDGLVLQPANEQNPEFVCSCCGCCCGMLNFQKKLPRPVDFWSSNFYAEVDDGACSQCGICATRCQVKAMTMNGPDGTAQVNTDRCIGCGLCVSFCPSESIRLVKKQRETVPPYDEEELNDRIKANRLNHI